MKLKLNQIAPNFKLASTDGTTFELKSIKKKNIILYLILFNSNVERVLRKKI